MLNRRFHDVRLSLSILRLSLFKTKNKITKGVYHAKTSV